jgi:3-deoxy-D-manno-octulosonic-acid transferase
MLLFDFLYLLLIIISLPLWVKLLFKKEYRTILKHRLSPGIEQSGKKRIWIHAVSVGEVKSVRSLIEQLAKKYKQDIVLSVTTPAGFSFAEKEYKDINVNVINAPLDFSFTIKKFLKNIDPWILILNELEIWPNWILKTNKAKIPIVLINGRISDPAFKKYKTFKWFLKRFMYKIDLFLVQAEIYKEKFSQLDIPKERILVCGNIKADTAFAAAKTLPTDIEILNYLKIYGNKNNKKIITLASSHPEDEQVLLPVINKLREKYSFIIVPRHLKRTEDIERMLKNHGVSYARWSETERIDIDKDVLLFDEMGYLFHVLKISDIVFMGGTCSKKTGGHNLYEPAALGKLIVGGPHYNNFPDIGRELADRGVYKIMSDADRIAVTLLDMKNIDFENIKALAVDTVVSRRGSVECILKEIQTIGGGENLESRRK